MSKLDATGESLESILASIRRSLTEQSTDILADEGALPPVSLDDPEALVPDDEAPPRFLGNGAMNVPHPAAVPLPNDQAFAGLEDPPPPVPASAALRRLDEDRPPPVPAAVAAPPQPEEGPKDPLWFLTSPGASNKNGIPVPPPGVVFPEPAPASVTQPSAATLKEIVRGPLPPFFGSSPEAAKVEVAPAPPLPGPLPGAAVILPAVPPPALVVRPSEGNPPRAGAQDSAPRAPAGPAGGATREGTPTAKTNSLPAQSTADSATPPATGPAPLQGLEVMVADLLRPMLRRWLDENMPRLVSAALKAEAENQSKWDPKKP